MKYIKPMYKNEDIETNDVVLTSVILEGGATLNVLDESTAQISASVNSILGRR